MSDECEQRQSDDEVHSDRSSLLSAIANDCTKEGSSCEEEHRPFKPLTHVQVLTSYVLVKMNGSLGSALEFIGCVLYVCVCAGGGS